ncbi:MAG: AbrB/MazE/SpoVT family DNA-binding domain-containing protein [Flavobacteriales bacterium]|nr:AbrB/MazE/SpoVT family DNA-binding domain-containing protein [Flavobacteriales bacterium]
MKIPIIKIGNSKGLRIPKMLIDRYAFEEEVEVELTDEGLVVHPVKKVRQGWGDAFAKMHKNEDDVLLMDDIFSDEEWDD